MTVGPKGKVTAVGAGSAKVTVTTKDGAKKATVNFTVKAAEVAVTGVEATIDPAEIFVGKTAEVTATVAPANATDKTITYTSSDKEIATVDEKGVVTGVKAGEATITVASANGKEATVKVTVNPVAVEKITMPETLELTEKDTKALEVVVTPENATDASVTYTSSDEKIATVDEKGTVTAVLAGTATITATSVQNPEIKAECKLTVKALPLAVESATALNLNQIEVVFNKEVDKKTAETAVNYSLGGVDLINNGDTTVDNNESSVSLQKDKKTVVITLATVQTQYSKAILKVKGNSIYATDMTTTSTAYEKELTFSDTVVPTVKSVTVDGNKKITVEFSEAVVMDDTFVGAAGTKFKVDGQYLTNLGFSKATLENATLKDATTKYANKVVIEFATALNAGTHSLTVLKSDGTNLKDAAAFSLEEQSLDFTVEAVTTTPVISSVTGENNGVVYVTYDRSMSDKAIEKTNYSIGTANPTAAIFKSGTDNKVVELTFESGKVIKGVNVLVTKKEVVDTYGNKLDATNDIRVSFTATEDTIKPTVTTVTPITNTKVRIKFSEPVNTTYATNKSNYTVKDASGNTVTVDTVTATTSADTYDVNFASALTGTTYTITIKNVVDNAATPNVMADYTTTFAGMDDVAPTVTGIIKVNGKTNSVAVLFSEAMDESTIKNTANYQYQDNAATAVTRNLPSGTTLVAGADNKSVEITFPTSYTVLGTAATQYSVISLNISNVKDTAGNTLKNISTGLQPITLATAIAGPKYVAKTFKLTADTTKVVAEFEMDQAITSLNKDDFLVQGLKADSVYMSGKKVVLEFTTASKITTIKAEGKDTTLKTDSTVSSTTAYGTPISAINTTVYEDAIAPEVSSVALGSKANEINITFSESIDDSIAGSYTDDFSVNAGGTPMTVSSASVTAKVLKLTLKEDLASASITVKAIESNISILDEKDAAGKQTKYVPTTKDKDGWVLSMKVAETPKVGVVTYDVAAGTVTGLTTTYEYRLNDGNGWVTKAAGVTFVEGDIEVRTKATGSGATLVNASAPLKIGTITKAAVPTGVTYNVAAGTVKGLGSTYEYTLDSGLNWATKDSGVTFTAGKVEVRTKATATTLASDIRTLGTVTKAATPTAASGVKYDVAKGTVTGLASTYEYTLNNGTTWVTKDTGVTFADCDVKIRVKATTTTLASAEFVVGTIAVAASAPSVSSMAATVDSGATKLTGLVDTTIYEYIMDDTSSAPTNWATAAELTASGTDKDNLAVNSKTCIHIRIKATATTLASAVAYVPIIAKA